MKISINDHRKIHAIQEEFNTLFPFLKIEFLGKAPGTVDSPSSKPVTSNSKQLGELRIIHNKGFLTVSPEMSSAELEQNFRDVFGLNVRLYRKSGKEWLGITTTDKWSLEQQNKEGMSLSKLH
jgi:hypothetical protein